MDEHESRSLRCLIVCVAVAVCTLIAAIGIYNCYTFQKATAAGLVQRSLPGVTGVHWVKPDTEK